MSTALQLRATLTLWPHGVITDARAVVQHAASICTQVFGAQRVVLAWEDEDDPSLIIATASPVENTWVEESRSLYPALVLPGLEDQTFHAGRGTELPLDQAIDPAFRTILSNEETVYSTPLRGDCIEGRLFVGDPSAPGHEALAVVEILGRLIESALDSISHVRTERGAAVTTERFRVARDLHDGLLQSFTGVVLRLETVHDILEREAERARALLTEVQASIMEDQRDLRVYVEQLGPRRRKTPEAFDFAARTEDLRLRFERQWGVRLSIDVADVDALVWRSLGQETFRLIQEALANAAKHGAASEVHVVIKTGNGSLQIEVADNGSGFASQGVMTLDRILETGIGPAVLAQRVSALNGDLSVNSHEGGATVTILIPLGWVGA